MVSIPDPGTFEPPMVLASFHLGPIFSLGALLRQLPGDVLAFAQNLPTGPSVRTVHIEGTEVDRSAAFLDGINHLRQNGFVFIAADGFYGPRTVHITVLGQRVPLARGGFALSRITGAPMLPVIASWREGSIEIIAGHPIPAADESVMAVALGEWLDHHLRDDPGPVGPGFIDYVYWLSRADVLTGSNEALVAAD